MNYNGILSQKDKKKKKKPNNITELDVVAHICDLETEAWTHTHCGIACCFLLGAQVFFQSEDPKSNAVRPQNQLRSGSLQRVAMFS